MSVFVVLGLIWAAVLVPPILRARAARRAEFIESFRTQMGALGKKARVEAEPVPVSPPPVMTGPVAQPSHTRRAVNPVKRRRDIVGGLLGAMIGSLVLGAVPSLRVVWVLHLFLVNVFIGYLALLAHQRQHVRVPRMAQAQRAQRQRHNRLAPALHSSH